MHIVRVNHKNGLYLEFLFLDPGRAEACAMTCADAHTRGNAHPPKDARCEVVDESGRRTWLDGQQMQTVQLVPLEEEVRFNTRMRVVAELTAQQWLKDMGLADHPMAAGIVSTNGRGGAPEMDGPTDPPAIGHFSA